MKKRTSTRTSAATSRDPSGDRLNQQRIHHVGLSRDPSGDRLAISSKISRHSSRDHMRSDSRASNYSGGLPDLEVDETIHIALEDEDQTVQRTQSLLVSGVDMDKPVHGEVQKDMLARREEVLKEIAQHKKEIREAKGIKVFTIYIPQSIFYRLDTERFNDSCWFWCDGLPPNLGVCWSLVRISVHSESVHKLTR